MKLLVMRLETKTIRIGEWLGDVPADWDYDKFHDENLSCSKEMHDQAVALFTEMARALKQGRNVFATQTSNFTHEVSSCGLYDGWAFWEPRPCYSYKGPISGKHIGEYYDLRAIKIVDVWRPNSTWTTLLIQPRTREVNHEQKNQKTLSVTKKLNGYMQTRILETWTREQW